jgi:hypothetical protein
MCEAITKGKTTRCGRRSTQKNLIGSAMAMKLRRSR